MRGQAFNAENKLLTGIVRVNHLDVAGRKSQRAAQCRDVSEQIRSVRRSLSRHIQHRDIVDRRNFDREGAICADPARNGDRIRKRLIAAGRLGAIVDIAQTVVVDVILGKRRVGRDGGLESAIGIAVQFHQPVTEAGVRDRVDDLSRRRLDVGDLQDIAAERLRPAFIHAQGKIVDIDEWIGNRRDAGA